MINLNLPNVLTFARALLSILVVYFLFQPTLTSRVLAAVLFTIAAMTDLFDGQIARKYGSVTKAGKIMDPIADKMLNLGCLISFSILKLFSFWWLVPVIIREVFITAYRLGNLKSDKDLGARKSGKIKTVLQIITIAVIYLVLLLRDYTTMALLQSIMTIVMYSFIILTLALTLYSGFSFLKEVQRKRPTR